MSDVTVTLRGQRVRLTDKDLLGVGGEARVFRHGQEALKVFHPIGPGLSPSQRRLHETLLDLKREKLACFPADLPSAVVGARSLLHDDQGEIVGFAMPAIEGADEVRRLGQRKFRQGLVRTDQVLEIFEALHEVLTALHERDVVVGDLNDGNVLFKGSEPYLIDADSMQFGPYPCPVGHERTLDPLLYGVDLLSSPGFSEASDWYAFDVLLFSSLLYLHPYGGVSANLPTLLRRAEGRWSILRDDVTLPRTALLPQALSDDLLARLSATFDEGKRAPFDRRWLEIQFGTCAGCGLEHARTRCPACSVQVPGVAMPTQTVRGRCAERVLVQTLGTIVDAVVQGRLRYLVEEHGIVRREDGTAVLEESRTLQTAFAIAGERTWVGRGSRLVAVRRGVVEEQTSTGTDARGRPTFAATEEGLLRTAGDWLLDHDRGRRLGRVLDGQTQLLTAGAFGVGTYRAGRLFFCFLVQLGQGGIRDLPPLPLRGRVTDVELFGDQHHALLAVATEDQGRVQHALFLFNARGQLVGELQGSPDEHPALAYLGGKALASGRILSATPEGLVLLEPRPARAGRTPQLHLTKAFPDAAPFVSGDVDLHAGPGGTVYVVTPQTLTQLELHS